MDPLRFLFYGHSGSGNRGCEAIVRSSAELLHGKYGDRMNLSVATVRKNEDLMANIPYIDNYIDHYLYGEDFTFTWLLINVYRKLARSDSRMQKMWMWPVTRQVGKMDVCFSIGGDNYCYNTPGWLYAVHESVKKHGKVSVLWGCSIEPGNVDSVMKNDLRRFDLIVARETITFDYLKDQNLNDSVCLATDPAFTMKSEEVRLPDNWLEGNTIGLNLSPLIMEYEKSPGITFQAVFKLVEYMMKHTDSHIALIPHVTWDYTNDLKPLRALYDAFRESGRIILIDEPYNAPQLKYCISRCRLFIGARTHATIAAYSTGVPTLVIGYSVKSRGIARDLFKDEKGLVIPVQAITDERQLEEAFEGLLSREQELRSALARVMPGYIARAQGMADLLDGVVS